MRLLTLATCNKYTFNLKVDNAVVLDKGKIQIKSVR